MLLLENLLTRRAPFLFRSPTTLVEIGHASGGFNLFWRGNSFRFGIVRRDDRTEARYAIAHTMSRNNLSGTPA